MVDKCSDHLVDQRESNLLDSEQPNCLGAGTAPLTPEDSLRDSEGNESHFDFIIFFRECCVHPERTEYFIYSISSINATKPSSVSVTSCNVVQAGTKSY